MRGVAGYSLSRQASADHARRAFTAGSRLRKLLADPLLHFLVAGALIFGLAESIEHYRAQYRIVVTAEQRTRIAESYRQQYGSPPAAAQLEVLLGNFVREEILYREALALELDQGDEIVRRRLAQKLTFLQQDLELLDEPDETTLRAFHSTHGELFATPARRTLMHVYFSPDRGGVDVARSRAERALLALRDRAALLPASLGDPFPGPYELTSIDADTAARVFGRSGLADSIFSAPLQTWAGPFRSGYGWHLVRVVDEQAGSQPAYEEVAPRVRQRYLDTRRDKLNSAAFAEIARKYTVVREDAR